jgi:hypothetical protein
MTEKKLEFEQTIKFNGIFSYKDLYEFCYSWLKEEEGYKVKEEEYSEKIGDRGKDIDIVWKAEKKLSDYYKLHIETKWKILGLSDVTAEIDGKQEKSNKGNLKIAIKGFFERDYGSKWEKEPKFLRKMVRDIYDNYINKQKDELLKAFVKKVDSFAEDVKGFLNIEAKK